MGLSASWDSLQPVIYVKSTMCDSQGESVSCRVLAVTYIPAWIRPLLSAGESNPLHAHWNSYKLTKLVISCGMSLPESLKVTNCSWPFPVTDPHLRHAKWPTGHFPWQVPTCVTQNDQLVISRDTSLPACAWAFSSLKYEMEGWRNPYQLEYVFRTS